jgi:peptide/nickel transport system substrate-binding protein
MEEKMETKKNGKRLLVLILSCIMVLSMAACGSGGASSGGSGGSAASGGGGGSPAASDSGGGSANSDRILNIAVAQDQGTLHPQNVTGAGGMVGVVRTIYETLYTQKQDGSFDWMLATGMDTLADDHYTIHLREGVTFNNGNPFTAEDVIYSFELFHGHPQHSMAVMAVDFDKTNIVDDYTIDLWLTSFNVIQLPAFASLYIFDAESYDEDVLVDQPISTGPYNVSEYVVNSHVYLTARDDYWGETPAIKEIHFLPMNEDSQRVNALTTGDADVARIPTKDAEYVESLGNYTVDTQFLAQGNVAYFNCTPGEPLGTLEARQAVMHAIDRQALVDVAYAGKTSIPAWPVSDYSIDFVPDKMANKDDAYSIGYDPALAKELAEKSGLAGKKIRIVNNGQSQYATMAEIIQSDLAAIGVESEILTYDQATYFGTLMDESNFDIALYFIANTIGLGMDCFANYPVFLPLGWSGPARDEYLALGQKGMTTADTTEREKILLQLTEQFYKQHLWFTLTEEPSMTALSDDLAGVEFYLDGTTLYKDWSWA